MLTTVRHIFGRIMHSETALCSQWDKGWKNNLLFASPSIRRPTFNACFLLRLFDTCRHDGNGIILAKGKIGLI